MKPFVIPVVGTTGRQISVAKRLHLVADEIAVRGLKENIEFTAEGAEWYAVVMFGNGLGIMRGRGERTAPPPADVLDRMVDLAVLLNREMHYGGHWVVFWADDRMHALYRDAGGNGLVSQKFDDPWVRVQTWPLTDLAERCEVAMAEGIGMLRDHGARPGEAGSRFN
jgi:hypothetical protein